MTAAQGNNKPLTFPPQPLTKTSNHEGSQTERQAGGHLSHTLSNPRSDHPPSGVSSEAPILVDRQKALINLGAQVSSVSSWFCEKIALQVHPLDRLMKLETTSRATIPYMGYVEVNLQIPVIRVTVKDVILLVILTMTYAEKVRVMVGSKIINRAMGVIMRGKLAMATATWRQAHFSAVLSRSLQLPFKHARGK